MAEVLTVLRIEITGDNGVAGYDAPALRALLGDAGAAALGDEPGGGLVAAFDWASDAVTAALALAGRARPGAGLRVGVATGEVELDGDAIGGPARCRADELARLPGEAPVLLANATAMLVLPALPDGAELVDRGVVAVGHRPGERVYELRAAGPEGAGPGDDRAATNLAWARRAAAGPVVGRDHHLGRLEAAWRRALGGVPQVMVVSGEAGIGKTTLAAELALRVDAGGGMVLHGRWDRRGIDPYRGVREALGGYAAGCPPALLRADLADRADELTRLLPELGARLGDVRAPRVDDPEAERARLFDAVGGWVARIAGRHPVLAVLDDMQWADESSLALLGHLLDTPPAGPILAVITWRSGDADGAEPLPGIDASPMVRVERIELRGLEVADVVGLVAQTVGGPLDTEAERVCATLTRDTAGNPLFLNEILAGLGADDPAADLRAAAERLPSRVHDVVGWRLSRLDPAVAAVAATASLLGDEFDPGVVADVLDLPGAAVRTHLEAAARAGVARDVGGGRAAFAHSVVRRALQDGIDPARAAGLHRRIARALERRAGGGEPVPAAEVAYHWLETADPAGADDAVRWARAAAEQARRETAFESAVRFLARAVEAHDRATAAGWANDAAGRPDDELDCELRLELAEAHDRAGEFAERDRRHLEAAALARTLDRPDWFDRAALGYGGRLPASPDPDRTARDLLREALTLLPAGDSRARALTLARLAHVLHYRAPHDERRALADEAEAIARRLDAPVVLASVLCSRVLALNGPDDVDDELAIGAEVVGIGEHTGDDDLVLQGMRARIQALVVVGAHDAARDAAERFTTLAESVRHPDYLRLAAMWRTTWAAAAGDLAVAEAGARRLRRGLADAGHRQADTIWLAQMIAPCWLRGDPGPVQAGVDAGRARRPRSIGLWAVATWARVAAGDIEGAAALLAGRSSGDIAAADRNSTWTMTAVAAGLAALATGHEGWAAACHDALAPYGGRNCTIGWAAYHGAVDHHLGALGTVLGRDDAVERLEAALARHHTIGARPWAALSAAWLANALAGRDGRGDTTRAAELHRESREEARELGLAALPPAHPRLSG